MMNSDLGVTFVPQIAVNSGLLGKTNIEVKKMKSDAYREIEFVWRKESPRSDEFHLFADLFRELAPA